MKRGYLMKLFLMISLFLGGSSLSNGATFSTQTLVPRAGQHEVAFSLLGRVDDFSDESTFGGRIAWRSEGLGIAGKYYYGLTENHTLGFELGYTNVNVQLYFDSSFYDSVGYYGIDPLTLKYKGRYDLSAGTLHYGIGFGSPLQRANLYNPSYFTGFYSQSFLAGSVGFLIPVGSIVFGGFSQYVDRKEGEYDYSPTTKKTVNGNDEVRLTVVVEWPQWLNLNLAFDYWRLYQFESRPLDFAGGELSCRKPLLSGSLEFIPRFRYFTPQDKRNSTGLISKLDFFVLEAQLRMIF